MLNELVLCRVLSAWQCVLRVFKCLRWLQGLARQRAAVVSVFWLGFWASGMVSEWLDS